MKDDFPTRCVNLVIDRIAGIKVVQPAFKCTLEEKIKSTQVPDDFDHDIKFTLDYSQQEKPLTVSETLTITRDKPYVIEYVGPEYVPQIVRKLNEYVFITQNFKELHAVHFYDGDYYKSTIHFHHKNNQ